VPCGAQQIVDIFIPGSTMARSGAVPSSGSEFYCKFPVWRPIRYVLLSMGWISNLLSCRHRLFLRCVRLTPTRKPGFPVLNSDLKLGQC